MKVSMNDVVVRSVDGSVDHEASILKFAEILSAWEVEVEAAQAEVRGAVEALFDRYKGVTMNKKFIVSQVCQSLNATPETWADTEEKIVQYLKDNSQGDNNERPDSRFVTKVGKGGGTFRRCDAR